MDNKLIQDLTKENNLLREENNLLKEQLDKYKNMHKQKHNKQL